MFTKTFVNKTITTATNNNNNNNNNNDDDEDDNNKNSFKVAHVTGNLRVQFSVKNR